MRASEYLSAVRQFLPKWNVRAKLRADWESWLESLPEDDYLLHVRDTENVLRLTRDYNRAMTESWYSERGLPFAWKNAPKPRKGRMAQVTA